MTNHGNPATIFFLKPWLSLFFRITLQQHVVQESEPGSSEHVQMLARAQVLDGHKSGIQKLYLVTALQIGCMIHTAGLAWDRCMFEQMRRKGCSIRLEDEMLCCTMYLDKDCFLR